VGEARSVGRREAEDPVVAFESANGLRIHYEERGSGFPVLVIPGIPAVVSDCLPILDQLAGDFRAIAYDNRGSGASDKPDEPYSIALLAADAVSLLDALGVERAHVVGFSMGGMIAQEIALGYPRRVDHLVLACTHCGLRHSDPPVSEAAEAFQLETDSWSERIRGLARFAFAPDYFEREPSAFDAFVAKKIADEQPLFAYKRQLAASVRHDTRDRLHRIESPTLVLTGSEDLVIPASNSGRLAEAIPNAKLAIIEGARHLFFAEKPEETRRILRSFLLDSAAAG